MAHLDARGESEFEWHVFMVRCAEELTQKEKLSILTVSDLPLTWDHEPLEE